MDLKTRVQGAIQVRKLSLRAAYDAEDREESEAKREKRMLEGHRREYHNNEIRLAQGNVSSAIVSLNAVSKFPPIR